MVFIFYAYKGAYVVLDPPFGRLQAAFDIKSQLCQLMLVFNPDKTVILF